MHYEHGAIEVINFNTQQNKTMKITENAPLSTVFPLKEWHRCLATYLVALQQCLSYVDPGKHERVETGCPTAHGTGNHDIRHQGA